MPQPRFVMCSRDQQECEMAARASQALPGALAARRRAELRGCTQSRCPTLGRSPGKEPARPPAGDRSEIVPSSAEEHRGRAGAYTAGFVWGRSAGCVLPGIQFPD